MTTAVFERDCNTCQHHVQGGSMDDQPPICWNCSVTKNYSYYVPIISTPLNDIKLIPHGEMVPAAEPTQSALEVQVGGDHYKRLKIQPVEYCIANRMDFFQKDIIKYVSRRKGDKAKRIEDLRKAKHYIDLYIEAIESGKWE